jgi:DNA mismatch endonuclease (patch repair protein)
MKGNRRADTRPERLLRAAIHARGLRFRKDYPVPIHGARPTRVDVAFTRARVAVFVDGCFWHACPLHGNVPSTNPHYWPDKLRRNRARDRLVTESLQRDGWTVVRIWEHEDVDDAARRVLQAVSTRPGAPRGPRPRQSPSPSEIDRERGASTDHR